METLQKNIIFSFGAVSLAFFVMTVATFVQVNRLTESSRKIQNIFEPSIEANLRMTIALSTSLNSLQSLILSPDDQFIRQRQAAWSIIEKKHTLLTNYSMHWEDAEQREKLERVGKELALLKQHQNAIEKIILSDDQDLAAEMLENDYYPASNQLIATLRQISDPQNWEMERMFLKEERQEQRLKNTAILFLVISLLGTSSLGILLTRAVITPLNHTIKLAGLISKGEYSFGSEIFSGEEKLDIALKTMTTQLYEKSQENEYNQRELKKYNQELIGLNAELNSSNEELSQFSYRTSHDLKAPVIAVRGLAIAIDEDIKDGDYQEAAENANKIVRNVRKLEKLVEDILSLAKAELEIAENEQVNLKSIVSDIQERLQSIYIENEVDIETKIDESVGFYLPKARIRQVLENLISNAIKYSDAKKPSRFVKISTLHKEGKNLCIVEDNGIGIPEEFTGRIFEMFQRFHPHISYGSGLGMYIIKKHLDKMEGKISFTSSERGTTFVLEFPNNKQERYEG